MCGVGAVGLESGGRGRGSSISCGERGAAASRSVVEERRCGSTLETSGREVRRVENIAPVLGLKRAKTMEDC